LINQRNNQQIKQLSEKSSVTAQDKWQHCKHSLGRKRDWARKKLWRKRSSSKWLLQSICIIIAQPQSRNF